VPIMVPVGPNAYGRIPTFRFIGKHQIAADASGGVNQVGFTLPTGVQYQGTEWTLDSYSVYDGSGFPATLCLVEVRGGEVMGATALDWWRAASIEVGSQGIGYEFGGSVASVPGFPFRLESDNSYVRLTVNCNVIGHTYEFMLGGHIYLPANLSRT